MLERLLGEGTRPMETARIDLVARLARSAIAEAEAPASILSSAAASYGVRPANDATVPTGFDPVVITLFEAIVEGAYLVANADGVFDDAERCTFERVVSAACAHDVTPQQIAALVGELGTRLRSDGIEGRIRSLGRMVFKVEHAREVLRIAALLAQASDDVSAVERRVLSRIASELRLAPADVDAALAATGSALAVAGDS